MKCKCGFENATDARFCGRCRTALGNGPGSAVSDAVAPSTAPPATARGGKAGTRPLSRVLMAVVVAVVVAAAAGYWWLNRPPGRFKQDNGGLYPINANGRYGFIDRSGKTIITPQFDGAFGFSEGLAQVRVGAKSGYINTKGVLVITPQFDAAMQFQYGRAAVKLCCGTPMWPPKAGDRFGFIDKDGKYISSPDFRWVGMFSGDLAPVVTADGAVAFVNRSGKIVFSGKFDVRLNGFTAGLAPAASGGKWGYIDTTGKWVINPQFEDALDFADGLAPVKVGGRWGYIDQKGKFVVNPQYDSGGEFFEGYASFASGGKSGFIDTKGRVIVPAKFLAVGNFSEGLAPVKTEDGWGYIDKTGTLAVSSMFDTAEGFSNGLARVMIKDKELYLTTAGALVSNAFVTVSDNAFQSLLFAKRISGVWSDSNGTRVRVAVSEFPAQFLVRAWRVDGKEFASKEDMNAYERLMEPTAWEAASVKDNEFTWRDGKLSFRPASKKGYECPTVEPCSTVITTFRDSRQVDPNWALVQNATLVKDMSEVFEGKEAGTTR